MAKKLLATLFGAGVASAWWSLTLWDSELDKGGNRWTLPVFITVIAVLVVTIAIIDHWDDKS